MKPIGLKYIIIHHAVIPLKTSSKRFLEIIDETHKDKLHKTKNGNGLYTAYHYCIDKKGEVHHTRPVDEVGYHAGSWWHNLRSIGICLQGDFTKESPEYAQRHALSELIKQLMSDYGIERKNVLPHRAVKASTQCPGIPDDLLNDIIDDNDWKRKYENVLMDAGVLQDFRDLNQPLSAGEVYALIVKALQNKSKF
jgi:N-acetyl-anhydromuramyl-L-alanine amidase AmpD